MIAGTGSDVGKSLIAAGLCRIFRDDGYSPAPFKAQNMALNSAPTPDGREIGRAQAAQAEACGLAPDVDMNPLLLKPSGERTSQVVLLGRPIGNRDAYDWYRSEGRESLRQEVCGAFDRLEARYNPIVLEGAGSIAELNLEESDLVNMSMARYADADVILVADIDRGGVFASAYGSIMLQHPEDRRRIKGLIVNKFRGDKRLFNRGAKILEDICQVPVIGVVPMATDIHIDEEDSVALGSKNTRAANDGRINVGVPLLPRISNFTDFGAMERDGRFCLYYTSDAAELSRADMIILPGSKATIADLVFMRERGLDQVVVDAAQGGKPVVGICGGYQMMGRAIHDPDGIEGNIREANGLGLLDVNTTLGREKRTLPMEFTFLPTNSKGCRGYEIHQGHTELGSQQPVALLPDGATDGAAASPSLFGTYLHGLLDNRPVRDYLARLCDPDGKTRGFVKDETTDEYDKLAAHLRAHLDIDKLYSILLRDND